MQVTQPVTRRGAGGFGLITEGLDFWASHRLRVGRLAPLPSMSSVLIHAKDTPSGGDGSELEPVEVGLPPFLD